MGYGNMVCNFDVDLASDGNYILNLRIFHSAEIYDIWYIYITGLNVHIILCFNQFPMICLSSSGILLIAALVNFLVHQQITENLFLRFNNRI